jgi:hypothetical protein
LAEITETKLPKTKPAKTKTAPASKKDEIPKAVSFFDRMAAIEKADWGTRAKVKVYRLEPLIDQIRVSGQKYIAIYEEALTEERLKQDCGSGRYRLYLTFKGPTDFDKEIDSIEIELLDPHYPPKIPAGAWLDDPRNKKWAWAKPMLESKEQQPAAPSLNGLADTLRAVKEILPPQGKGAEEVLNTIRAVKEMTPIPPPATQDSTLTAIVELVKTQNTTAQAALTAAQERADKLLMQLIESRKGSGLETFKGVLTEIKDVFGVGSLKDLFTMGKDAVSDQITRHRRTDWMDILQTATPKVMDLLQPFAMVIGQNLMARAATTGAPGGVVANPGMQGAPPAATGQPSAAAPGLPPPAPANGQPANFQAIAQAIGQIAQPLLNYIRQDAPIEELGQDFASWIYDGFGPEPQERIRTLGVQNLVMVLRNNPIWHDKGPRGDQPSLAELGPKVDHFLTAFLAWKPEEDGPEEEEEEPAQTNLAAEVFGS